MPTPTYRTPVRIARGTYASLNASIADLLEGEIVYATDQDIVYVKEGGVLVSTQSDLASYLTSSEAASTYQTQAAMNGYLETSAVGVTVQSYDADTAKTDVAQTFTAPQRGQFTTLSINAASVSIDFSATNLYYLDLVSNVSSVTFSNVTAGQSGSIIIRQDATNTLGGWPAAAKFKGGTAPTITATAGNYDRIDYICYDTNNVQMVWTGGY